MMDAVTYAQLKLDMNALEDLHQAKTHEILFVETDLELDLNNEMITIWYQETAEIVAEQLRLIGHAQEDLVYI